MSEQEKFNQQDEVVSVEPGQETLSVEEEIKAVTPDVVEEVKEEVPATEEVTEEDVKDEKPSDEGNDTNEEGSKEVSEDVGEDAKAAEVKEDEEKSEKAEEEESKEETEKEGEKDEDSEESKEDTTEEGKTEEQESEPSPEEKMAELERELEALRDEQETKEMIDNRQAAVVKAAKDYDDFNAKLGDALLDTFKQYGIDPDQNIEELKKDPAKFQIAQDIVRQAQTLQAQKQQELMQPITQLSNQIVFKKAGQAMSKFELTDEQSTVAAETLINILNQTGLADLDADLKAKVELAVARAKMIAPKVAEVVEDVKEAVKDVIEAEAPKVEDDAVENALDKVEENKEEVKEETVEETEDKKDPVVNLDAFKEGANTGDVDTLPPADPITEDNVLQEMAKLNFKDRAAFYKEHMQLINNVMAKRRK